MTRLMTMGLAAILGLSLAGTARAGDSKQLLADNATSLVHKGRPGRVAIGLARPAGRAARAVGRAAVGAGRAVRLGRGAAGLARAVGRGIGKAARGIGRIGVGAAKVGKPFRLFKKRIIVP